MTPAGTPATTNSQASGGVSKVAIVGMSCLFPGAPDLASFWQNIVNGFDAIRDATDEEWEPTKFYNPNPTSFEQIYCKKGGFITELADFDPLKYGVMPNSIPGSDPDQLLALRVATEALADAGYSTKKYDGNRAEVILGRTSAPGAGSMNMIQRGQTVYQVLSVIKALHPDYTAEQLTLLEENLKDSLKQCSSDTIPAVMPNILAGRIAGRLGFKGKSTVLDSACASSLISIEMAVNDLQANSCDLALAGGIHVNSFAVFYQMFCGLGALSKNEKIRPYDENADGTLLGEGLGMVVLKRLDDAIADGDRIYAVITGIGSSSDGQGTSMLAPSVDGEALALQRAYDMANISPRSVQLLEGHGTGTPSGDAAELQAIEKVYGTNKDGDSWCAIGSVKSMIGHTQAASGVAGLIKTALSLYHRILPPTLNVDLPSSQIDWQRSPCYINSKTRTWVQAKTPPGISDEEREELDKHSTPRRAAVSAFGFGGVNAHAILEEYSDDFENKSQSLLLDWETEMCLFAAKSHEVLLKDMREVAAYIKANPTQKLRNVAYSLATRAKQISGEKQAVAIVASTVSDLSRKLSDTIARLEKNESLNLADVYHVASADANTTLPAGIKSVGQGKLAFVMPGLGAAYPNMLQDLCYHFPEVRIVFDYIDLLALHCEADFMPSRKIFPRGDSESVSSLAAAESAVVNVLMAEWALYTVLQNLGIKADALLGCSTGEFATLPMGGCVDILKVAPLFFSLSTKVARSVSKEKLANLRSLMLIADWDKIEQHVAGIEDLYLGSALCPSQTLVSGSKEAVAIATKKLEDAGFEPQPLPMAIPYHTPLVEGFVDTNQQEVAEMELELPSTQVWSCSRAGLYPNDVDEIREITTKLFTQPIMLKKTVEAMYEDGVTMFVEVGPKGVLTPLIGDTLQDKQHLAVATNTSYNSGITQLNHCLAELAAHGVDMQLDYLFTRRSPELIDFAQQATQSKQRPALKLDLKYPVVSVSAEVAAQLRTSAQNVAKSMPAATGSVNPGAKSNSDSIRNSDATASVTASAAIEAQQLSGIIDQSAVAQEIEEPLDVVHSYLNQMAEFHHNLMGMQEEVMRAYLAQQEEELIDQPDQLPLPPFLRNGLLRCEVNDHFAEAELFVTLDHHRYLLDHAIGGNVSNAGPEPERVYLLPLTVALEAMAEISSLLMPGFPVVRISSVRAARRIKVGRDGATIKLQAHRVDNFTFEASIDLLGFEQSSSPSMSCKVEFGEQYPPAEVFSQPETPKGSSTILPPQLYQQNTMFHGPRMQSVVALECYGKRTSTGFVQARPATDWFPNDEDPRFLIDPLLLDNSTQIVLFHLFEKSEDVSALLPFLVESLDLHADIATMRGTTRVTAVLHSVTTRGTEADVYIMDGNDVVLAKFTGISSRRIILSDLWKSFIYNPSTTFLSGMLPEVESVLAGEVSCKTATIHADLLPTDESTLTWCLDYVFHNSERQEFLSLTNLQRKREWFCGRIAAKEAVRRLMLETHNMQICSADVIIAVNEQGQRFATGKWIDETGAQPFISISHKNGHSIAIAAYHQNGIGIDLEVIEPKEEGFEKLAFLPEEIAELEKAKGPAKEKRMIEFWSAKESVGKAIGSGLSANPRSLKAKLLDESKSETRIAVSSDKEGPFAVHVVPQGKTLIAVTTLAKS